MFKRSLCLLLALATMLSLAVVAIAAESEPVEEQTVVEEVQPEEVCTEPVLYVNGQLVCDAGMTIVNDRTYVSVRAFFEAALPGCTVEWVDGQAVVSGTTAQGETLSVSAKPGECYIVANERYLYVEDSVQIIDGMTMVPVRVLGKIFNSSVWREGENWDCHVLLGESLLTSGSEYYDREQLDLLSRLIYAEAGNQPMQGKIAVGNVIFNRVADSRFPDTIYGVIYAKNQFSVVKNGTINKTPNASSVIAAKLTFEGAQVLKNALYFHVSGLNCWAARNCDYVATIGNHDFYA